MGRCGYEFADGAHCPLKLRLQGSTRIPGQRDGQDDDGDEHPGSTENWDRAGSLWSG